MKPPKSWIAEKAWVEENASGLTDDATRCQRLAHTFRHCFVLLFIYSLFYSLRNWAIVIKCNCAARARQQNDQPNIVYVNLLCLLGWYDINVDVAHVIILFISVHAHACVCVCVHLHNIGCDQISSHTHTVFKLYKTKRGQLLRAHTVAHNRFVRKKNWLNNFSSFNQSFVWNNMNLKRIRML